MRALLLALSLLCACDRGAPTTGAEPPAPARPEPPAAAIPARPLLWVVDAPDGPSYLLGTMHIGIDADRDLPGVVLDLLGEARVFVMEADLSKVEPDDVLALAQLPAGEQLDGTMSAQQWRQLTEVMPLYPEERLRRLRPWFVVVALAQSMVPHAEAMDAVLLRRARHQNREVAFLETWRYQLEIVDEVTGIADLVDILDNFDDTKQEMVELATAYRAGDAEAIAAILFAPDKYEKNPKLIDILMTRRNKEWLPALEQHISGGRAFIAVGVGHLIGEQGLVALLRERGYRVERFTRARPAAPARPEAPASHAP